MNEVRCTLDDFSLEMKENYCDCLKLIYEGAENSEKN